MSAADSKHVNFNNYNHRNEWTTAGETDKLEQI